MKRQIDRNLPDRLILKSRKKLEEHIKDETDDKLTYDSEEPNTEGKINITVNNRNKIRLTEKVLDINKAAIYTIEEIIQSNNKVMEALDEGTQITVRDSTFINNNNGPNLNIETKQDNTSRESYEYDIEFEAIDGYEDEQAMAELQSHGFMSFPVVTVGSFDNAWTGFEIDKLEELL